MYLIQTAEQLPRGTVLSCPRFVGGKKLPGESVKQCTKRICRDYLGDPPFFAEVKFDFKEADLETSKEEKASPSYPGVRTIYRKKVVDLKIDVDVRTGFQNSEYALEWSHESSAGNTLYFKWLEDQHCEAAYKAAGIPRERFDTTRVKEMDALVQAPLGFVDDDLSSYLEKHGVDISLFGKEHSKTLQDLSSELLQGDCSLVPDPERNCMIRLVDTVLLKLVNVQTGKILMQIEQQHKDGTKKILNRLPGTKKRLDEPELKAARRLIQTLAAFDSEDVDFSVDPVSGKYMVQSFKEESQSQSYPGLYTEYRKTIVTAELRNEDDNND